MKKYKNTYDNILAASNKLFTELDEDSYNLLKTIFDTSKVKKFNNYRIQDLFGNIIKTLDLAMIIERDTKFGDFCNNIDTNNQKGGNDNKPTGLTLINRPEEKNQSNEEEKTETEEFPKYILTYTLMNILYYEEDYIFSQIRGGEDGTEDIQKLYNIYMNCWNSYNECCALHNNLVSNFRDLELIYNDLETKIKSVYSLLRIRLDKYNGEYPEYNHKFGITYTRDYTKKPGNV